MKSDNKITFIDLFAGLGGIRLGFEQACMERGIKTECIITSEIKPYAVETLKHNQEVRETDLQIPEELCFLRLKEF